MTDKQIIIDGVDVSGCGFLVIQQHSDMESDDIFHSCYNKDCKYSTCSNNFDCLYKQLKRKEQECEELKEEINSLLCSDNCYRNKKLKLTLTEIKEIAQYDVYTPHTDLCLKLNWIKKKISECEGNDVRS